jgi:hypothetical protein
MACYMIFVCDRMRDRVSMTSCRNPELDMRSITNMTSYRISVSNRRRGRVSMTSSKGSCTG